jgi:hypothetical protein
MQLMKKKQNKKNRPPRKQLNPDEIKEREKKDAFRQGQQDNSTSTDKEEQPGKKKTTKSQKFSEKVTNEDNDITNIEDQNRLNDDKNLEVEIPPLNPETEIQPTKM